MSLIYFRGLNCHLASLINIAHLLGVSYPDAFADLWSETDFTDEVKYNIYVSKRVFARLAAMGVMTEMLDWNEVKSSEGISRLEDGEMLLVGMDAFAVPWHPVFGHFHDAHYFFSQKRTASSFLCFDPVYNQNNQILETSDLLAAAFELSRVYAVHANPPEHGAIEEAKAVMQTLPGTREKWLAQILQCKEGDRSSISVLIKQISAMISNRYLFRRFLNSSAVYARHEHFFDKAFFAKWEAVKNGLYKAAIIREPKGAIDEVYRLFAGLTQEEMSMARAMVRTEKPSLV